MGRQIIWVHALNDCILPVDLSRGTLDFVLKFLLFRSLGLNSVCSPFRILVAASSWRLVRLITVPVDRRRLILLVTLILSIGGGRRAFTAAGLSFVTSFLTPSEPEHL